MVLPVRNNLRNIFFGQPIEFSADNLTLKGSLHRRRHQVHSTDHHPGTAVLLLHSMGGNRHEASGFYLRLAAELCLEGYDVLRFDFRGCGESEGTHSDFYPSNLLKDAQAAMNILLSESNCEHIHLIGYSLGGLIASMLMESHPDKLKSASLVQAPFNLSQELKRRFPVGRGDFRTTTFINSPMFRLPERFHEEIEALESRRNPERPVEIPTGCAPTLVITGTEDVIVPESNSLTWLDWLQPQCQKIRHYSIENADHGFSSEAHMQVCIRRLCEWLSALN